MVAMIGETNLIQCSCKGWMSPRAIYCPTCGAPVENSPTPRPSLKAVTDNDNLAKSATRFGWAVVKAFWGVVTAYIAVWALLLR